MPCKPLALAYLGLGAMGAPMTRRLLNAGFAVNIWNRSADKCRAFGGATRICSSPAEAARGVDFVLMCLLDTAAVEQTVFGAGGVGETIGRGAYVVDFSTISPQWAAEADRRLKEKVGAGWIDAPVSGGSAGAEAGMLSVFCGGDESAVEKAKPALESLARRIAHFGPAGSGLAVKLCNQTIVASQIAAIAEALGLAANAGLNPSKVVEALQGGWADSTLLQIFGPRFASIGALPPVGQIATMLKDVDMALAMGAAAGSLMPISQAAAAVYRAGNLEKDLSYLAAFYHASALY